jgi:hypothetical protein
MVMGNIEHQRGKNRPPHRGGGEDAHKQHAPSRHGQEGPGQGEQRRGSHRGEEQRPEPSETDFPNQQRSPSEELSSDDDND